MSSGLSENVRKLFRIFKKAIGAEKAAQAMYMQAKDLTDDNILKEVLEGFYQDGVQYRICRLAAGICILTPRS